MVTSCKVEVSPDPLSETDPLWVDVSAHLASAEWWSGKTRDLGTIESGGAEFVFDNDKRRFEPGFLHNPQALVFSGNEVTDAVRAAGVEGDGLLSDATTGIFRATENMVLNPLPATNTTGWGKVDNGAALTVLTFQTTWPGLSFLTGRIQVETQGAITGEGAFAQTATGLSIAGGETYSAFVWAKRVIGQPTPDVEVYLRVVYADASQDIGASATYSLGTTLARLVPPPVATNAAKTIDHMAVVVKTRTFPRATQWYMTRAQIEEGEHPTPFAETTRAAGRIQAEKGAMNGAQGWFAALVRPYYDSAAGTFSGQVFDWEDPGVGSTFLRGYWDSAAQKWRIIRRISGTGISAAVSDTFAAEEEVFVLFAWSPTELSVSVNGGAYTTAANTSLPTTLADTFDIGSDAGASNFFDGFYRWAMWGNGVAPDPAQAYAYALADPIPWAADFAEWGVPILWPGRSAIAGASPIDMKTRCRVTLSDADGEHQEGIFYLDTPSPKFRGTSNSSEITMTCVDGAGLLAGLYLPRMDPLDATDYTDVEAFDEPSLSYPFGEEGGTKAVQHARRKRKRRKGESKHHYKRHGYRRWTTHETRSEVEGISGPAGTYLNTPLLGEPGMVIGSEDTCVRFRRAQSESAVVKLEQGDLRVVHSVEVLVKLAQVADTQVIVASPFFSGHHFLEGGIRVSAQICPFLLQYDTALNAFTFVVDQDDGFFGIDAAWFARSTTTPVADTVYHVVGEWVPSEVKLKMWVNGALEHSVDSSIIPDPVPAGNMTIGQLGDADYLDGWLQHLNIYEHNLGSRAMDHYIAARLRGLPVQKASERIAALAANPLWNTDRIGAA